MSVSRRRFLTRSTATGAGIAVAGAVGSLFTTGTAAARPVIDGYGPLVQDPAGMLDLPEGFRYEIVSRAGDALAGGGVVPGKFDGTGTFASQQGTVLVRNHELRPDSGSKAVAAPEFTYDPAGFGGTSTVQVDATNKRKNEYVSLAGTAVNCAGGVTPWGTWLTCEETEDKAGTSGYTKDHGFVFEVDPFKPDNNKNPVPLTAMGRFAHEACSVDPAAGHVYLTEDATGPNGLFYRFTPKTLPNRLHSLRDGGLLEAMYVPDVKDLAAITEPGTSLPVQWKAVPDPLAASTPTRKQFADGEITRARKLEGTWWGDDNMAYFVTSYGRASDGSPHDHDGQVWAYDPRLSTITLKVIFAVNPDPASDTIDGPDNICYSPYGGVMLAEDGEGVQHLVGVTAEGAPYLFARNRHNDSEFAGVVYSPDGKTLFANVQDPGITYAITGPWKRVNG